MSCGLKEPWGEEDQGHQKAPWPPPPPKICAYGLDFGSRSVKLVYSRAPGRWAGAAGTASPFTRIIWCGITASSPSTGTRLGLPAPEALVATGYGKNLLKAHFPTITEIRAHFLGARFVTGLDHFILLEMGGQDTKVLYIREGRVFDFLTNDRCAAGTGRYLENMARFLKMPLAEFAGLLAGPGGHLPNLRHLRGNRTGGPPPGRGGPGPHRRRGQRLGGPPGPGHGAPLPLPHPGLRGGRGQKPGHGAVAPGPERFSGDGAALSPIQRRPGLPPLKRPADPAREAP